jgi:hypothetical protein
MPMGPGQWNMKANWRETMNNPGYNQLRHLKSFFSSLPWYRLVPDMYHALLVDGWEPEGEDDVGFVAAAATEDGALAVVYTPLRKSLTIDLSRFNGPVSARWYDPCNGTFSDVAGSPFDNTGAHVFESPGSNSSGDADFALILEAGADRTAPSLLHARSFTSTTVEVEFSEAMDVVSAQNPANYGIDEGVTISGALIEPDLRTVVLTTSELQQGTAYAVTATGVKDAAGNSLAPGAQAGFWHIKGGDGLTSSYFANMDLGGAAARTQVDTQVLVCYGDGPAGPGIGPDKFSIRWEGWLRTEAAGEYTFYIHSDDGGRMLVNGEKVCDIWFGHAEMVDSATVTLDGNKFYPITIELYDDILSASMAASWRGPTFGRRLLSKSHLYSTEEMTKEVSLPTGDPQVIAQGRAKGTGAGIDGIRKASCATFDIRGALVSHTDAPDMLSNGEAVRAGRELATQVRIVRIGMEDKRCLIGKKLQRILR